MRKIASILGLPQLQFFPWSQLASRLWWYYGNVTMNFCWLPNSTPFLQHMNFCCHTSIWTLGCGSRLLILYKVPLLLYSRMSQPLWSNLQLQAIESEMVNYWSCQGAWQGKRRSGKWVRLLFYLLLLPLLHKGTVSIADSVALQNKGKFGLRYVHEIVISYSFCIVRHV